MQMRKNKNFSAFTLIELMIVLAIIGILVGIAVPAYRGYVIRSHIATMVALFNGCKDVATKDFIKTDDFKSPIDCLGGITSGATGTPPTGFNSVFYQKGYTTASEPMMQMYVTKSGVPAADGSDFGRLYFGMYYNSQEDSLVTACGTWSERTMDVDPKYLPTTCKDQVNTAIWSK